MKEIGSGQVLYLLRHGQTTYNQLNIVQGGGIDSALNETGIEQARLFYERYKHLDWACGYASALKRTYETIQFFEQKGVSINKLPGLNELSWGEIEGLENSPEVQRKFLRVTDAWSSGQFDKSLPGGESADQVAKRAIGAIRQILAAHSYGQNILICSHGRTLRILLSVLLGYGLNKMQFFSHENTGVNILVHQGNFRFAALHLNRTEHLKN
ncbi:MAG: histidine phosphatase family protein [Bacteroidia bacterium]|nr:histidine phosphatase family protein [Bacteroidia bacterium]